MSGISLTPRLLLFNLPISNTILHAWCLQCHLKLLSLLGARGPSTFTSSHSTLFQAWGFDEIAFVLPGRGSNRIPYQMAGYLRNLQHPSKTSLSTCSPKLHSSVGNQINVTRIQTERNTQRPFNPGVFGLHAHKDYSEEMSRLCFISCPLAQSDHRRHQANGLYSTSIKQTTTTTIKGVNKTKRLFVNSHFQVNFPQSIQEPRYLPRRPILWGRQIWLSSS